MSIQQVDESGNLWLMTANDNHTNVEGALDSRAKLYFQSSKHSDFLHLTAHATIHDDKAKIEELWNPLLKTHGLPKGKMIRVFPCLE